MKLAGPGERFIIVAPPSLHFANGMQGECHAFVKDEQIIRLAVLGYLFGGGYQVKECMMWVTVDHYSESPPIVEEGLSPGVVVMPREFLVKIDPDHDVMEEDQEVEA